MITVTQEFETEQEALRALQHKDYFSVLWDFNEYLRQKLKHGSFDSDEEFAMTEEIETTFHEFLNRENIDLYRQ